MKNLFSGVVAPDITLNCDAEDINEPHERNEEKNDSDDNRNSILFIYSANDTVDCPNDIECGDSEDDLYDKRKIIKCIDEFFH